MNAKDKKALYESIMRKVAVEVKKAINESDSLNEGKWRNTLGAIGAATALALPSTAHAQDDIARRNRPDTNPRIEAVADSHLVGKWDMYLNHGSRVTTVTLTANERNNTITWNEIHDKDGSTERYTLRFDKNREMYVATTPTEDGEIMMYDPNAKADDGEYGVILVKDADGQIASPEDWGLSVVRVK